MTSIKELVEEINRFEAIISEWDESQRCVASGLKRAIEDLHKEALTRMIKSLKEDSMPALKNAVKDEVVYGLLVYHELVKPPTATLIERVKTALDEIRPSLQTHSGDVELVGVKESDTVEVKLIGTCGNCPSSTLTLSQLVETAIKEYCPEIKYVKAVK
ncbi:thioredoxin-like protein [Rivularia sp. PCC 7116]|uniref:NifU family protein n=1 Tax=Rivularia sp. PCC 7116 TaxID=373994 RepID=UPI00029EF28F|nr:NifU family protein [Rivularia sp. PCC 7116]AFY58501.1 thioredoxin-like protein [Rivularia sp. PCC 7116]